MSKPSFAISRKVNPPGATKLSAAQVWEGLQQKARDPAPFLGPMIKSSEILEDKGNTLLRRMTIEGRPPITEKITLYDGAVVVFDSVDTGTSVHNTLSYNEDNELILTFCFAGGIPGHNPSDVLPPPEELNKSVEQAVSHTLATIREFVGNGRIKAE